MVSKLDEQDDIVNRKGDPPGNEHPQEPKMRGIPDQVEGSDQEPFWAFISTSILFLRQAGRCTSLRRSAALSQTVAVHIGERLAVSINHLEPACYRLNGPWWWEASHRLRLFQNGGFRFWTPPFLEYPSRDQAY